MALPLYFGTDISGMGPVSTSTQQSGSSSSSKSGVNWDLPFMKKLSVPLLQSAEDLPGVVAKMGDTLQGQYSNLMRQGMGPNAFTGTLNALAARGMLHGNIATDAIASAGRGIAENIGNQSFNSNLAQQQAQMQVPTILAQIAELARETKSSGGSYSKSDSSSTNPLSVVQFLESVRQYQPTVQG